MKIVLNKKRGSGFNLSPIGILYLFKLKNMPIYFYRQVHFKNRDGFDEWQQVQEDEINNSESGYKIYLKNKGQSIRRRLPSTDRFNVENLIRTDLDLVQTVNDLGFKVNTPYTYLTVNDILNYKQFEIIDNDGVEEINYFKNIRHT